MKIAQIAPPWIAVPPPGYGGIEWVVALLADGLTERGHDVTLFAPGDSQTKATLDYVFDTAPGPSAIGDTYLEVLHAHHAYARAHEFDVIHDHTSLVGLAIGARQDIPVVHTLHGPLDERARHWYGMLHDTIHIVAISDSQYAPAPDIRIAGRVYNGIPLERYPFTPQKEDFLFFVGRAAPEKGAHTAVEVARKAGVPLTMAVAIKEKHERAYWDEKVAPLLTDEDTILGEITVEEKADLMARARAVLFPITWPEPFGLVMAEANACGTPVLAFPNGAAPEVIGHGETGYLVDDAHAMAAAVDRLDAIDPHACRARVERLFSGDAMCAGYEEVYERILS